MYLDNNKEIPFNDDKFWKQESEFWSKYGKIYRHLEAATPYKEMLSDIGQILSKKNYKIWLDAGCGPGTMIEMLLKHQVSPEKIIGIDFDGVMLDQATKRLMHLKNVEIRIYDLSKNLDFENNYFDGVIANLVLSYVIIHGDSTGKQALIKVLQEIYRVLKPSGLFIWTTPVENVKFFNVLLASWRQLFNPLTPQYIYFGPRVLSYANEIQRKGTMGIYHFYNEQTLKDIMQDIGFKDVTVKKTFANQAYLLKAIK